MEDIVEVFPALRVWSTEVLAVAMQLLGRNENYLQHHREDNRSAGDEHPKLR
jgi:hypothetical protein